VLSEGDSRDSHVDEVMDCARAVETAIHQLCRASGSRPRMTPADVSAVLADLAAAAAALPQVAGQLGDILKRATDDYLLKMDATADGDEPDRDRRASPAPPRGDPRSSSRPQPAPRRSSQRDCPHRRNRPASEARIERRE
jgi:hypothetical protein